MKFFVFFTFLLLGTVWCNNSKESGSSEEVDIDEIKKALRESLAANCARNAGEEGLPKFRRAVDRTMNCAVGTIPDILSNEDITTAEEMCSTLRGQLRECSTKYIGSIEDCLDPEEKYLPRFLFDSADSLINHMCNDGIVNLRKVLSFSALQCVFGLLDEDIIDNTYCRKLTEIDYKNISLLEDKDLDKDELCTDLSTAKQCLTTTLSDNCKRDTTIKNFISGVYDAIKSPCAAPAETVNNRKRRSLIYKLAGDSSEESNESGSEEDYADQFISVVKGTCIENGGKDAWEQLKSSVEPVRNCLADKLPEGFTGENQINPDEICEVKRRDIRTCLEGRLSKIENCLAPADKFLPRFVLDSTDSLLHHMCNEGIENIRAMLSFTGLQCGFSIIDSNSNSTEDCIDNLPSPNDASEDPNHATKEGICNLLTGIKTCSVDIDTVACKRDTTVKTFVAGVYDAMRIPCAAPEDNEISRKKRSIMDKLYTSIYAKEFLRL